METRILAALGMLRAPPRAPLRRSPLSLLLPLSALWFAAQARASSVRVSWNADCALKPAWSSSSEDLYQLAHDWSKTHDISDWEFSTQANNCSKVTYKTTISVPSVFSAFWKSHVIHMNVDKRLCVRGQSLRETLVISNMPFIDDVLIRVEATASAETGATSLSAEYAVVVPWYLAMLDAAVQAHVKTSLLEYLDLLKRDICR